MTTYHNEIDKSCVSVLSKHFPSSTVDDRSIADVKPSDLASFTQCHFFAGIGGFSAGFERAGVDPNLNIWTGGFPCQDLSIAGKRAGLSGERSGLFFEFIRLIDGARPDWVIIENVPGLLSSNKGKDIQIVIDEITKIGYTVDIDIKDSQEFGVAQRRRRVFLVCVKLDGLLQKKTNLSRQISADLLAQILLNTWAAIPQASSLVRIHWNYEKPIERCVTLHQKMTNLLEITRERLASKKYQSGLDVLLDQFGAGGENLELGSTEKSEQPDRLTQAVDTCASLLKEKTGASGDLSIFTLLSNVLEDVYSLESKSITSTSKKGITETQIFIFATTSLTIIALMLRYLDWSVNCWSVAQSISTLLQENMNYAREASRSLFIETGLRDSWRNYLSAASYIQNKLERNIGGIRAAEVLFEREGSFGNPAPSREKGQETTGHPEPGAQPDNSTYVMAHGQGGSEITKDKSPTLSLNHEAPIAFSPFSHYGYEQADQSATIHNARQFSGSEHLIVQVDGSDKAATLRRFGHGWQGQHNSTNAIVMAHGQANAEIVKDGSPSLTLNHEQPIVAYNIMPTNSTKDYKAIEAKYSQALTTDGNHGANQGGTYIAYDLQQITSKENRSQIKSDYTPTLNQAGQMMVGVRRLTPTECERLQGFPDGFTDGQSDSARYRQLGNAVTVNVIEWIARRIQIVEKGKDFQNV